MGVCVECWVSFGCLGTSQDCVAGTQYVLVMADLQ